MDFFFDITCQLDKHTGVKHVFINILLILVWFSNVTAISVFQLNQAFQMILCSDRNKISSNYSHKYSGIIKLCYYCSYICVCLICRHLAEISIIFSSSLASHTKNTLHCSTVVAYRESLFLSNNCWLNITTMSLTAKLKVTLYTYGVKKHCIWSQHKCTTTTWRLKQRPRVWTCSCFERNYSNCTQKSTWIHG